MRHRLHQAQDLPAFHYFQAHLQIPKPRALPVTVEVVDLPFRLATHRRQVQTMRAVDLPSLLVALTQTQAPSKARGFPCRLEGTVQVPLTLPPQVSVYFKLTVWLQPLLQASDIHTRDHQTYHNASSFISLQQNGSLHGQAISFNSRCGKVNFWFVPHIVFVQNESYVRLNYFQQCV